MRAPPSCFYAAACAHPPGYWLLATHRPLTSVGRSVVCATGEGGVRAQTFLHWAGFDAAIKGTIFSGLAHVSDWGITLVAALGFSVPHARSGQIPFDGMNLWPALSAPGALSPRTEMLLSMRDAAGHISCGKQTTQCTHRGELAYRKGRMKLIYGHTALRGAGGAGDCQWTNHSKKGARNGQLSITCWNGWSRPYDLGPSRPPTPLPVSVSTVTVRVPTRGLSR